MIKADGLSDQIAKELTGYSKELGAGLERLVDQTAKELVEDLKRDSPKSRPEYYKNWRVKKEKGAFGTKAVKNGVTVTVYNKLGNLTHLLEYGHALHQGGRAEPRPHIAKDEQKAILSLEEKAKKMVEHDGH